MLKYDYPPYDTISDDELHRSIVDAWYSLYRHGKMPVGALDEIMILGVTLRQLIVDLEFTDMANGTFVEKPGSGVLFPNSKKNAENQPDYRGTLTVDFEVTPEFAAEVAANVGKKISFRRGLSAWVKESAGGKRLSIAERVWEERVPSGKPDADPFA